MSDLESRIERLEKQTGKEIANRETLLRYPGGEIRHCDTDGPVTETQVIECPDKHTADLTLRIVNGELPGGNQLSKLGLDPEAVKATAKENNQSIAEVTAGELGISYQDFVKTLKLKAQGR